MSTLIQKLQKSDNKLLIAEASDLSMLKKLKHNKKDLELFLNHCITELSFVKNDGKKTSIVCTSNTPLISVLTAKKADEKKKKAVFPSKGIMTNDSFAVNTWDLIDNKMKTVPLTSWQIINFILITEKNILIIDQLIHDILKR